MDEITRGQIESVVTSINYAQDKMNDASQLKILIELLKEDVEKLKSVWNTVSSEGEIEKLKTMIHDLDMIVVPKNQIAKVKTTRVICSEQSVSEVIYGDSSV